LKQIKYQEVNKPIIVDFIWGQFCEKHENALELIQFKPEYGAENLITHIQNFLDTEFNSETSQEFVLKKLKELRNKNVAHNENTEITSQLLFEESEKLIFLADAILDFINTFLSLGQSVIYSDLDYVINLQLDRIINKVNHEQF
jgi:CRISPR/Cas system-associated endonuclease Cas1